jgi:hypothetical protein
MTSFLTRWTKPAPATGETPATIRREEFASAVATFRKATGKPEARIVPCRCAVTSKPFVVVFERISPAHRFQIARLLSDDASTAENKAYSGLSARKPARQSYDAGEFDWTGCACPFCGNRAGVVYCDECAETVCAGRVRSLPDGGQTFACHDACGATGTTGPAAHVHGGAGDNRPAVGQAQLPRRSAAPQALPQGSSPRPHK